MLRENLFLVLLNGQYHLTLTYFNLTSPSTKQMKELNLNGEQLLLVFFSVTCECSFFFYCYQIQSKVPKQLSFDLKLDFLLFNPIPRGLKYNLFHARGGHICPP